jgi:hypothetical protein
MSKKYIDFESKKTVHFTMTRETHSEFRIACFKQRLTMQDILEEFAQLVAAENPAALRIMKNLSEKKRNDEISRLTKTDSESILNIISEINPLSDDTDD